MKKLYKAIILLSSFGILLALYLLWQQMFQPAWKPCSINSLVNCDSVISGPVALTLGIPTPLIGLIGYIVILLSAIYRKKILMLSMATFGLLFCLWIGYREFFELKVICPVCIGCELTMIAVFVLSLRIFKFK